MEVVKILVLNWVRLVLAAVFSGFMVRGAHAAFNPVDNFLIACGSSKNVTFQGRTFVPDSRESSFQLRSPGSFVIASSNSGAPSPIYQSMRVFPSQASYLFDIHNKGRHWVRLYFYPIHDSGRNIEFSSITVITEEFVLLNKFSFKNSNYSYLFKEYVINVKSNNLTITFIPSSNAVAFVNALEVVSAPDKVFSYRPVGLYGSGPFRGLSDFALETVYRLNMGGPLLTPENDTLGRTWENDQKYIRLDFNTSVVNVAVSPAAILYEAPVTRETAPNWVYATAVSMGNSTILEWFFNVTWEFPVDPNFTYFVRLHFCDIVSKSLHNLAFNVYINYDIAIEGLDLSTFGALAVAYFQDFIIYNSSIYSNNVIVSMGPISVADISNLTMNGLEIMKISNDARSLDGFSSVEGLLRDWSSKNQNMAYIIGLTVGALVVVALISCFTVCRLKVTRQKRPLLAAIASIWQLSNHDRSRKSTTTQASGSIGRISLTDFNLARFFSLQEIMVATSGFDQSLLLGVGGFGNVYMGTLEDGAKVAIKRANPWSRQGPCEFQTEIKILSKVRHRHLVSLFGYCDEQSEMILVYEYMANGTLRSHLYGTDFPSLSWTQRLEICIGAARGLHYLHTGAAQSIIHRDIKTTNILLDENFVAKVADFGLSKIGPGTEQTHVSTVVKGTFGYFDPEYIRKQQLTAKSDVYSFGVVLMEVLCARPVLKEVLPSEEVYIVDWAISWQKKGMLEQIMDPDLVGKVNTTSLKKFSETAEMCLAQHGVDRPTMGNVLSNLEYALQVEETSSSLIEPEGSSTTSALTDPEGSSNDHFYNTIHD